MSGILIVAGDTTTSVIGQLRQQIARDAMQALERHGIAGEGDHFTYREMLFSDLHPRWDRNHITFRRGLPPPEIAAVSGPWTTDTILGKVIAICGVWVPRESPSALSKLTLVATPVGGAPEAEQRLVVPCMRLQSVITGPEEPTNATGWFSRPLLLVGSGHGVVLRISADSNGNQDCTFGLVGVVAMRTKDDEVEGRRERVQWSPPWMESGARLVVGE